MEKTANMKLQWKENYGENILVLMPRDPWTLFAYWETTPQADDEIKKTLGTEKLPGLRRVLRLYKHAAEKKKIAFDIDVGEEARNWYIHIGEDRRSWSAEIGLMDESGQLHVQAASEKIEAPEGTLSDKRDTEWSEKAGTYQGGIGISSLIAREK